MGKKRKQTLKTTQRNEFFFSLFILTSSTSFNFYQILIDFMSNEFGGFSEDEKEEKMQKQCLISYWKNIFFISNLFSKVSSWNCLSRFFKNEKKILSKDLNSNQKKKKGLKNKKENHSREKCFSLDILITLRGCSLMRYIFWRETSSLQIFVHK